MVEQLGSKYFLKKIIKQAMQLDNLFLYFFMWNKMLGE